MAYRIPGERATPLPAIGRPVRDNCRGMLRMRYRCGGSVAAVWWQCNGNVVLGFAGLVQPYQRISHLVDEQIQRRYRLDLSVRQLQAELAQSNVGLLALGMLKFRSQGYERE